MSDIAVNLNAALAQVRQELGTIQRAGRGLTRSESERMETLQQVEAQLQQALHTLFSAVETAAVEPVAENAPAPAEAGSCDEACAGETTTADIPAGQVTSEDAVGEATETGSTGGSGGERFDPRVSEMMNDGLAGYDDTDDY